jgi:uncharacterized protein (DUF433 family)
MLALTPTEVSALTGLDERAIRKDLEQGVLEAASPPRFTEEALVYFFARALFAFHLATEDRKRLHAIVETALSRKTARVELGRGWVLDVAALAEELRDRVRRFERWKRTLVTRDDILGGETVFPRSRLSVRHVGEMLKRGEDIAVVREDYPNLSDEDIEFAPLYATAYPRMGRPRAQVAS